VTDAPEPPYPASEYISGMDVDAERAYRAQPGSDNQGFTWLEDDGQGFPFGDGGGFHGNDRVGRVMNGFARLDGTFPHYEGRNLAGGVGSPGPQAFPGKSISALDVRGDLYMWRNGDASNPAAYHIPKASLWTAMAAKATSIARLTSKSVGCSRYIPKPTRSPR
jgi:hypothetical protein